MKHKLCIILMLAISVCSLSACGTKSTNFTQVTDQAQAEKVMDDDTEITEVKQLGTSYLITLQNNSKFYLAFKDEQVKIKDQLYPLSSYIFIKPFEATTFLVQNVEQSDITPSDVSIDFSNSSIDYKHDFSEHVFSNILFPDEVTFVNMEKHDNNVILTYQNNLLTSIDPQTKYFGIVLANGEIIRAPEGVITANAKQQFSITISNVEASIDGAQPYFVGGLMEMISRG